DEPVGTAAVPPDAAQAEALADGEPTRFAHAIDFDALAAGADVAPAPERTTQIRIFPSALRLGEGRDFSRFPQYRGQLQPYSLTVPSAYREGEPSPFTLNLHSLTRHHWQYHGSEGLAQIGEELDTLVLTPLARGVNGWYQHEAEFDVFEAWADVARHYDLDAERVAVAGYSMGGYGAYRLATLYPDLFGRAMTVVGPPGEGAWSPGSAPTGGVETLTNRWLASARHVPFLNVVAARDVVVPIAGTRAQSVGTTGFVDVGGFEQLGYRYRYVEYPEADHHTLAVLGYGLPMATDFLSRTRVVDGPARVTYVVAPGADDPALGLVHDHAYWVSGLRLAPTVGGPDRTGRIDAYSWASGVREPSSRLRRGGGDEPLAYTEQYRTWSGPPKAPAGNRLDVTLANLYSARLELEAAGLSTAHDLVVKVSSDAAAVLFLAGDWKPGTAVFGPDGKPVDGAFLVEGGLYLPVSPGSHGYTVRPGSGPPD
ncbi:MAG: alpha/beta hydrolase-fold protein, partial [Acidimicrobiia bacterium]